MNSAEEPHTTTPPERSQANPGYALGQLARAFATSQEHPDPAVRARAEQKIATWMTIYQGMLNGALRVGSRTPLANIPAWATPEVASGGFATSNLLAGGALQPHELSLLEKLPGVPAGAERAAITSYYLSDRGLEALREMLTSGCYRIQVPEEGVLLVVAWLLAHGYAEQARALLDEIGPYITQLRFYPIPAAQPLNASSVVHRQTVGEVVRNLYAMRVPREIAAAREAVTVWIPLYDQVVALFAETVSGPLPVLRVEPDQRQRAIDGGWPCQQYPEGWQARAQAALDTYHRMRVAHTLCNKPDRPGENFAILRRYLQQCVTDPRQLSGRDVGMIRSILAAINTKRGLPGSPRCEELRQAQRAQVARPTPAELAPVLAARLAALPQDEGLATFDSVLGPVTPDEAGRLHLPAEHPMPAKLGTRLQRCLEAPVELLVEQGVIPSSEVLAQVIPQITAQMHAAGITDDELRRLYSAIYAAFRRRRSLLLLNLEHQVRLTELPWVAAINAFRTPDLDAREQARQTLEQVVILAISAFPHQILPNKLLQEIRALAERAELHMPIVDELAADIFMGDFSIKYLRAAQIAGRLLAGTLYARYYGIAYDQILQIDDVAPSPYSTPTSVAFTSLCYERAGIAPASGHWSVANNGMVIEQEQILTTHNLAVLVQQLELIDPLRPQLEALAQRCFTWICRSLQQQIDDWQPRLRMLKNCAYAWRQMIFYLSLLPPSELERFLAWARQHLAQQRPAFQARFQPALQGLALVAAGGSLDAQPGDGTTSARRFLGWANQRHWLMADET